MRSDKEKFIQVYSHEKIIEIYVSLQKPVCNH
jgi:hypothetical protein